MLGFFKNLNKISWYARINLKNVRTEENSIACEQYVMIELTQKMWKTYKYSKSHRDERELFKRKQMYPYF